jgi:hypothetical protein
VLNQRGIATWTIERLSTGFYCFATTPNLVGNYGPVIAGLRGRFAFGFITVNTETSGDPCRDRGMWSVSVGNPDGSPSDRLFFIAVL